MLLSLAQQPQTPGRCGPSGQMPNGPSVLSTRNVEGSGETMPPPANLAAKGLRQADAKFLPRRSALPLSEDVEVLSFSPNPGWSLTWQSFHLPYLIARHKARSFNSACSGQGLSQMPTWVPGCTAPQVPGGHPTPPAVSLLAPLAPRPHTANSSHHPWKKQNLDSFTTKVLAEHQSCRA